MVSDDAAETPDGRQGWFAPHFQREALVLDNQADYAGRAARLRNARAHEWMHPIGDVLGALGGAGLALERLRQRPRVTWQMFKCLARDADGLFAWPDRPRLPLAYSLSARKGPRRAPLLDGPTLRCDRRTAGRAGPRPVSAARGRTG